MKGLAPMRAAAVRNNGIPLRTPNAFIQAIVSNQQGPPAGNIKRGDFYMSPPIFHYVKLEYKSI